MASKQSVDINEVIKLANDEVIIKTYEGFEIIEPVGKGFFTITNHRFIYYSTSNNKLASSKSFIEWELDQVSGIASEYGKRDSAAQKIISYVLLGIAGAGLFYVLLNFLSQHGLVMWALIASAALLVIGLFIFLFRKRQMFFIEIFTKSKKESIMAFSSTFYRPSSSERIKIKPNKHTVKMIQEIGSTIIEAKQYRSEI